MYMYIYIYIYVYVYMYICIYTSTIYVFSYMREWGAHKSVPLDAPRQGFLRPGALSSLFFVEQNR